MCSGHSNMGLRTRETPRESSNPDTKHVTDWLHPFSTTPGLIGLDMPHTWRGPRQQKIAPNMRLTGGVYQTISDNLRLQQTLEVLLQPMRPATPRPHDPWCFKDSTTFLMTAVAPQTRSSCSTHALSVFHTFANTWVFVYPAQESLDWILCSMNVSSKATGDPPVVAAFCLGAYDSNFLLRFGMARRDDDRPAALDGRHFFELESLRIPLQLTPLASKHRGEFTYCTMRGAGRSTCRGCYFDQLDDPDAATSESCAKCAFVAGLEDVYSHLQDHDFLAEMERWLLGWRDPRGMRRRWLSLTLERSESALSCVAERVVSFVFPEGHPLDTIQAEDLRYPR
ncbi:unnamed protein product [Durusdinium trenchii]|uniref:Uncharacterized protein n=1 Tax=Durusdinium trenchii TaxID=1381693 RepID=A0ABP0H9L1_9DINO